MFKNIILVVLFVSLATSLTSFSETATGQEDFDRMIVGGHVFDTASKSFKKNEGIVIKDGRFVHVFHDKTDKMKGKTVGETVSLEDDQYILPGLVDCHAHYNVKIFNKRREEHSVMPVLYLANGATTTFSCGEFEPDKMVALRKRIAAGKQIGPNLITSGPYFGRARPGWRGGKSEQEIRDEVDYWVRKGSGGFKAKAIDPKSLKVLIDQAHKHGLTVTGHLDSGRGNSVNPRDAIEMGIDRIEHFIGGDAMPDSKSAYAVLASITRDMPEYKKAVKQFVDNDVVYDATLTAYGYLGSPREEYEHWIDEKQFFTPYVQDYVKHHQEVRAMKMFEDIYLAKQKTIAAFHEAGGKLSMGTDHVSNGNFVAGFGVHRELDAYSRSGIPNADVLVIGTINGAKALKIDKDYGSIENGKVADLFIVTGNPIEKIRNTRNVNIVVRAGKLHFAKELLNSVKGKLGPTNKSEERDW